jgi:hypothetical protein
VRVSCAIAANTPPFLTSGAASSSRSRVHSPHQLPHRMRLLWCQVLVFATWCLGCQGACGVGRTRQGSCSRWAAPECAGTTRPPNRSWPR